MEEKLHFVYRLTYKYPFDERKYYVGKHSGKLDDFETGKYKTSCKKLRNIFNINDFDVKIVKIFDDALKALHYEAKYHQRLNVQDHPLFFNEQNQIKCGNYDRTDRVTVIFKDTGEKMTISSKKYKEHPDLYESLYSNKVLCKDKEGNTFFINKEEFDKNENFVGVNKDVVHVIDKKSNKRITITTEEFRKNREKYKHWFDNCVTCYDALEKTTKMISSEEFYSDRERYKGIKFITGERKKKCDICGEDTSSSNYDRHREAHFRRYIWVTDNDNLNTIKVKEDEFYLNMKDTHYKVIKNKDETCGYYNGEKLNIRLIGKLRNKDYNTSK